MINYQASQSRVHIVRELSQVAMNHLMDRLNESIQVTMGKMIPYPADYQVLVDGVPTREFIEASSRLESLIIPWAGLSAATRELMLEFPHINVHNLHHNAIPTAEMALALLFSSAKFLIPMDQSLRHGDWSPRYQPNPSVMLQGKTVLILGYGAIGQHLGRVLKSLGLRVLGIRRNPKPDNVADVYPIRSLDQLLPTVDVLMVTLPLTPDTKGLIGAEEMEKLPSSAILVNVGRGEVVDQEALFRNLETGKLLAAGLDVWYKYPPDEESRRNTLPAEYPFHELDNVVLSPHRGGGTRETEILRMEALAVSLNASACGKAIPNKVDIKAGY